MMKAAVFDMDGVIVDNNEYHKRAFQIFLEKHGIKLSDEEFQEQIFGKHNKEIFDDFFSSASEEEKKRFAWEKEAIYREMYAEDIKPVPGLVGFLEKLKDSGIMTGVATAGPPENLQFVLEELELEDYFDAAVDSSMVENSKPDSETYLRAAEELGVKPEECVVFEDSPTGIESARRAGMKVVAVMTTYDEDELEGAGMHVEDFVGLDIDELIRLLLL